MENNANSGYKGYSMSVRAEQAYEAGEKPLSKWTKDDILSGVRRYHKEYEFEPNFSYEKLSKLTLMEMKENLLKYSSSHHTSAKFNLTSFYEINFTTVDNLTDEKIDGLIAERQKRKEEAEPKEQPKFITAYVEYDNWVGQGKWKKRETSEAIVQYKSTDKLVSVGIMKKRLSSLSVVTSLESEREFPIKQAVLDKYLKTHENTTYNRYIDNGELRIEKAKKSKTAEQDERANDNQTTSKPKYHFFTNGTEWWHDYDDNGRETHRKVKNCESEYEEWYSYHNKGELKSSQRKYSDGKEELWEYTDNGKLKSYRYKDIHNNENLYEYNEQGREIHFKNNKGYERWREYNSLGGLISEKVSKPKNKSKNKVNCR